VLTAFARAFRTPDLRKKLLFTLGIIVVYRVGTHVPIPGVNYSAVQECVSEASGNQGLFGLVNMFSGGALLQITIFALGIMPYITASIILQLLTVVIPRLEALKKEGSPSSRAPVWSPPPAAVRCSAAARSPARSCRTAPSSRPSRWSSP
jgi:preprotein translocase subunit SecY